MCRRVNLSTKSTSCWTGTPDHGGSLSLTLFPLPPSGPPLLLTKGGNTPCFRPLSLIRSVFEARVLENTDHEFAAVLTIEFSFSTFRRAETDSGAIRLCCFWRLKWPQRAPSRGALRFFTADHAFGQPLPAAVPGTPPPAPGRSRFRTGTRPRRFQVWDTPR